MPSIYIIISMNSSKQRHQDPSPITPQKADRQNIDPQWSLENQQLQNEAEANSRLREQIPQTKQSYADSAVQASIKDKINMLKEKAVRTAQNLESEKRKNLELTAIIRHMTFKREEQKNIQAAHRDDASFETVDNLFRRIKKSEYDLEQMFAKLNDLTSRNKEKKSEVDTYRTQRVIDSGIFLKIQKEIVQSETEYKKLLIERTKFQQEYGKALQKYKKMKADIEKQQYVSLSKRETTVEKQETQEQFFLNMPEIEHAVKFTEIGQSNLSPQNLQSELKRKSFMGSRKVLGVAQLRKQQHHQQVQYAVKKIFIETGLNSAETLIDYLNNIQKINEKLYEEVNHDTDKICELSRSISQLQHSKAKKTIKYYEREPEPTKNQIKIKEAETILGEIGKTEAVAKKMIQLLEHFTKTVEIREISKLADISHPEPNQIDALEQFFSELEKKLSPMLANYCQFKRQMDEPTAKEKERQKEKEKEREAEEGETKQETIDELISKVKRMEESQKIMVKEDFKKEYQKILRSEGGKTRTNKKKPTFGRKH